MPKYRVTLRVESVEVVEADNPYMAAVVARDGHGAGVDIVDVRPAVGRAPAAKKTIARKAAKKTAKKAAVKKRRRLSAEARAKLAQNLVKARAARARNVRAAKGSSKRVTKKRSARKQASKRK